VVRIELTINRVAAGRLNLLGYTCEMVGAQGFEP
jgi:hypothetical protein